MRKLLFVATFLPLLLFVLFVTEQADRATATLIPVLTNAPQPTATFTPTATPNSSTFEKSDWLVIFPALLTFLAAIIASCSWPVTILFLLIILRKPVFKLLEDVKLFRFKDFEFEFGKRVQKLEQEADEAKLPPTNPMTAPEEKDLPPSERVEEEVFAEFQNRLYRLAEINPRGAVIEAWILVESALRQAAERAQIGIRVQIPTNRVLNLLRQQEVVPPQVLKLIDELRVLRNYAAHETDFTISMDKVIDYIDISLRVINVLRKAFLSDKEKT